ncbi:hypothetical protein ACFX13_031136 [Malus domestica]
MASSYLESFLTPSWTTPSSSGSLTPVTALCASGSGTTECLMRTRCGVDLQACELNDGSTLKKSKEIQARIHGVPFSPCFYICGGALQQRSLNPFSAGAHRCICVA